MKGLEEERCMQCVGKGINYSWLQLNEKWRKSEQLVTLKIMVVDGHG